MANATFKRNIYALAINGFLRGVGVSIFQTLFPLYALYLGYKLSGIGVVITAANLIIIPIIPFIGLLIDYYGRKPFIIITGVMTVFSLLIISIFKIYIALIISYALFQLAFLAGQPARGALITESVTEAEIGGAVGLITSAFFVSRLFMPSVSGLLADLIGYNQTFLFGSVAALIGTLIFLIYGIETLIRRRKIKREDLINLLKPSPGLGWFYIAVILDRSSWMLWFPLVNAYLGSFYRLTATQVGILNSTIFLATATTQYAIGKWIDKIGCIKGLILSELIGCTSALLLGLINSIYAVILAFILFGLTISFWIPSYNKAVSLNTKMERRALEFSKLNTYRSLASTPSPYIGGIMYDYIAPSLPFIISSLLMMTVAVIFYRKISLNR